MLWWHTCLVWLLRLNLGFLTEVRSSFAIQSTDPVAFKDNKRAFLACLALPSLCQCSVTWTEEQPLLPCSGFQANCLIVIPVRQRVFSCLSSQVGGGQHFPPHANWTKKKKKTGLLLMAYLSVEVLLQLGQHLAPFPMLQSKFSPWQSCEGISHLRDLFPMTLLINIILVVLGCETECYYLYPTT